MQKRANWSILNLNYRRLQRLKVHIKNQKKVLYWWGKPYKIFFFWVTSPFKVLEFYLGPEFFVGSLPDLFLPVLQDIVLLHPKYFCLHLRNNYWCCPKAEKSFTRDRIPKKRKQNIIISISLVNFFGLRICKNIRIGHIFLFRRFVVNPTPVMKNVKEFRTLILSSRNI